MLSGVMDSAQFLAFVSKKVAFRHAAENFRYCRLGAANASVETRTHQGSPMLQLA
jgi:hypothetical protein